MYIVCTLQVPQSDFNGWKSGFLAMCSSLERLQEQIYLIQCSDGRSPTWNIQYFSHSINVAWSVKYFQHFPFFVLSRILIGECGLDNLLPHLGGDTVIFLHHCAWLGKRRVEIRKRKTIHLAHKPCWLGSSSWGLKRPCSCCQTCRIG